MSLQSTGQKAAKFRKGAYVAVEGADENGPIWKTDGCVIDHQGTRLTIALFPTGPVPDDPPRECVFLAGAAQESSMLVKVVAIDQDAYPAKLIARVHPSDPAYWRARP